MSERDENMSTDQPYGGNGEIPQPEAQQPPMQQEPAPQEQLAYSAPPPEAPSIRDAFASRGYDTTNHGSDDEFIQTIESGLAQLGDLPKLQQMAQYGQQYLQQASSQPPEPAYEEPEFQEAPPEPVYESDPAWDPPEFDKTWDNLLRMDSRTGTYVPVNEHVNPAVAQKANEYRQWLRDQGQKFWDEPYEFMKTGLSEWVAEVADGIVDQRMGQRDSNEQVSGFLEDNANRFYALDESGNVQYDPNTGDEILTQEGHALKHYATQARQAGMGEPEAIQQYALGMVERDLYQQQAQQQYYGQMAQQQQLAQQQQQQAAPSFVQGVAEPPPGYAGYSPNRDATVASAAQANMAQNENLSFMDMALPELMNMGLVQQTG